MTTRIEGRAHEGLLKEKGFGGFPSLAFMDADGKVVAQPQGRSVGSFDAALNALTQLGALKERIASGESGLEAELLLVEHTLGQIGGSEFESRAAALASVTDAQRAQIAQILVNNEIARLSQLSRQGGARLAEAAEGMLKMLEEGKRPSKELQPSASFWITIARHGIETRRADLVRRAIAGLNEDLPGEAQLQPTLRSFAEVAEKLDRFADLRQRQEAGEQGLDVDLLLAAYAVGETTGSAFTEQATALLETATPEQCASLRLVMREVAFQEVLGNAFEGRDVKASAVVELRRLIQEGGDPPAAVAGRTWGLLSNYASQNLDADLLEQAADGLLKAYADNPGMKARALQLKEDARKLRAEKTARQ